VYYPPEDGEVTAAFWERVFTHDIVILRDFCFSYWDFDNELFSLDHITDAYGDHKISVIK
jgi:hypothetical protein